MAEHGNATTDALSRWLVARRCVLGAVRRTPGALSSRVLLVAGVLWTAKGLAAALAPSPALEPLYGAGFLGGLVLFVAALVLAIAGRTGVDDGVWIGALVLAFVLTALLISVGGAARSAGARWYGVEVPVVLAGLTWTVLSRSRGAPARWPCGTGCSLGWPAVSRSTAVRFASSPPPHERIEKVAGA